MPKDPSQKIKIKRIFQSANESKVKLFIDKILGLLKLDDMKEVTKYLSLEDDENNDTYTKINQNIPYSGYHNNNIPVTLPEMPAFFSRKISLNAGRVIGSKIFRALHDEDQRVNFNLQAKSDEPHFHLQNLFDVIQYQIFNNEDHPFFNPDNGHRIISHMQEFYDDNKEKSRFTSLTLSKELIRFLAKVMGPEYTKTLRNRLQAPRKK